MLLLLNRLVPHRIGDKYEILSGINNGDDVVIAGQVNLADGKEVEVIK